MVSKTEKKALFGRTEHLYHHTFKPETVCKSRLNMYYWNYKPDILRFILDYEKGVENVFTLNISLNT